MIHAVGWAMNNDSDTFYPYQNILQFGYRSTSLSIETASFCLSVSSSLEAIAVLLSGRGCNGCSDLESGNLIKTKIKAKDGYTNSLSCKFLACQPAHSSLRLAQRADWLAG